MSKNTIHNNQMSCDENMFSDWGMWLIGTIGTSSLPFLIALIKSFEYDKLDHFWDYVYFSDCIALLFAISVNWFILSVDRKKRGSKILRKAAILVSVLAFVFFGIQYGFAAGNQDYKLHLKWSIVVACIGCIEALLGCLVIGFDEKIRKKEIEE